MGYTTDCPLCEATTASEGDLRVHMMTVHRKSELVETVLERVGEPERDPIPA